MGVFINKISCAAFDFTVAKTAARNVFLYIFFLFLNRNSLLTAAAFLMSFFFFYTFSHQLISEGGYCATSACTFHFYFYFHFYFHFCSCFFTFRVRKSHSQCSAVFEIFEISAKSVSQIVMQGAL